MKNLLFVLYIIIGFSSCGNNREGEPGNIRYNVEYDVTHYLNIQQKDTSNTTTMNTCIDSGKVNAQVICTEIYKPVCACTGETFINKCKAEATGILKYTAGICPKK